MTKPTENQRQPKVSAQGTPSMDNIFDVKEFESYAQNILPENVAAFFSRGAGDEITLEENVSAFDRIKLLPRVLRNVEKRSLSTTGFSIKSLIFRS